MGDELKISEETVVLSPAEVCWAWIIGIQRTVVSDVRVIRDWADTQIQTLSQPLPLLVLEVSVSHSVDEALACFIRECRKPVLALTAPPSRKFTVYQEMAKLADVIELSFQHRVRTLWRADPIVNMFVPETVLDIDSLSTEAFLSEALMLGVISLTTKQLAERLTPLTLSIYTTLYSLESQYEGHVPDEWYAKADELFAQIQLETRKFLAPFLEANQADTLSYLRRIRLLPEQSRSIE